MHRRQFLKALAIAGGASNLSLLPRLSHAQDSFSGKLLMTLQLDGGVDVTAFCDPKMNVNGELEISQWSRSDETRTIGNLSYAPFANNQQFFEKYYQDMLVINGVDAQTNSHTVGVVNNWSGRNSTGYPTVTALYAASNAPDLPMAYLNFGGFGSTEGLVRSTRVDDVSQLSSLIFTNKDIYIDDSSYRYSSDWARIQELQQESLQRLIDESNLPSRNALNRQYFSDALSGADGLAAFGDLIPPADETQPTRGITSSYTSSLHQQIQVSLLAFSAGVSITADLFEGAFDTHTQNDQQQSALIGNTTDAIDYLWTTAEEMGLADRIVLFVGSDFGRTPHYNSGDGKDHWPIGSNIVMEKNAAFTNRVMGATDGGHNALAANLQNGTEDSNGRRVRPAHVHQAFREYLGIGNNALTNLFPFTNTEDFDFFS